MPAFKRTGLHRLNCPSCPGYAYATVANLESVGLPACACGETFEPERLELALMLGLETGATAAYAAKVSSVAHGQAAHYARGRDLDSPESVALAAINKAQREESRRRRLRAIAPVSEPIPF